ncbi:unnamed protein product [Rotaria sp. Silwood2]|nr:unnamed protein product [Rotaria sp. Silwood2]
MMAVEIFYGLKYHFDLSRAKQILTIDKLHPDDSRKYVCRVNDIETSAWLEVTLFLAAKPLYNFYKELLDKMEIEQDGTILTTYQKNNQQLQVMHRFWMDVYTISFMLSPTKHVQIMKSSYCNNGELVKRQEFCELLSEKNATDFAQGENFLCYVGSKFSHVFPQYIIRGNGFYSYFSLLLLLLLLIDLIGGDIQNFDGSGGASIYGKTFADENFNNKHNKSGLLSMVNFGPNTNASQFFISSIALPYFDDKYVE